VQPQPVDELFSGKIVANEKYLPHQSAESDNLTGGSLISNIQVFSVVIHCIGTNSFNSAGADVNRACVFEFAGVSQLAKSE
jgi:hypothetical protein